MIFWYFQEERDGWDPVVCFNFLDKFLSHVKRTCTKDDAQ